MRLRDHSGIIRDPDSSTDLLQTFGNTMDVSRAIIDYSNHKSLASSQAVKLLLPICTAYNNPSQLIVVGIRPLSKRLIVSSGQHINADCITSSQSNCKAFSARNQASRGRMRYCILVRSIASCTGANVKSYCAIIACLDSSTTTSSVQSFSHS